MRIQMTLCAAMTFTSCGCGLIAYENAPASRPDAEATPSLPTASPALPPPQVTCGIEALEVPTVRPSPWTSCGVDCESTAPGTIADGLVPVLLRSRNEGEHTVFTIEVLATGQPLIAARALLACGAMPYFGGMGLGFAYRSPVVPGGPRAEDSKRFVSLIRTTAPTKVERYELPSTPPPPNDTSSSIQAACVNMHMPLVTTEALFALRCDPATTSTFAQPAFLPGMRPLEEVGPFRRVMAVRGAELLVEDDKSLARIFPGGSTVAVVPNAPSLLRTFAFDQATDTLVWTERPNKCASSNTSRTVRAIQFPQATAWNTVAEAEGTCDDGVDELLVAGGGYVAFDALAPVVLRRSDGTKLAAKFEVQGGRGGTSLERIVHVGKDWLVTESVTGLKRRPMRSLQPLP